METPVTPETVNADLAGSAPAQPQATAEPQKPVAQAEGAEPAPAEAPKPQETVETGSEPGGEARVKLSELVAERKKKQQAESEAAYWRGQAEARAQSQPQAQTVQTEDPSAPRIEQFETYEAYERALTAHTVNKALEAREQQRREQERVKGYSERYKEASKAIPDLDETISNAQFYMDPRNPGDKEKLNLIMDSDLGPQIAYHLAKHPDEALALRSLGSVEAARMIGRLEATLITQQTPKATKQVTLAPEPIKPLGRTSTSGPKDLSEMTTEEFIAYRNAQERGRK